LSCRVACIMEDSVARYTYHLSLDSTVRSIAAGLACSPATCTSSPDSMESGGLSITRSEATSPGLNFDLGSEIPPESNALELDRVVWSDDCDLQSAFAKK
jgi:hypothetical protein